MSDAIKTMTREELEGVAELFKMALRRLADFAGMEFTECEFDPEEVARTIRVGILDRGMVPFMQGRISAEEEIARVCHEVNRAYCAALGDFSQDPWEAAPEWQRVSCRKGVDLHLMGEFGPEASHMAWLMEKVAAGWKYGPVKNAERLEHPCMVPFAELPKEQQAKDFIFRAVVHALKHRVVGAEKMSRALRADDMLGAAVDPRGGFDGE